MRISRCLLRNNFVIPKGTPGPKPPSFELHGWGMNYSGELDSDLSNFLISITKLGEDLWIDASVGQDHFIGIKEDGTLWSRGWGGTGALGISEHYEPSSYPLTQIGIDNDWTYCQATEEISIAIKKDGSLWGWGSNVYGQLGTGTHNNRYPTPIKLHDGPFISASTGYYACFFIHEDGSRWGCGRNDDGALGQEGNINTPVYDFVKLDSEEWQYIVPNEYYTYSMGIKKDGSLWVWGKNNYDALGIDPASGALPYPDTTIYPPIKISDGPWSSVGSSHRVSHATKIDGSRSVTGTYSWLYGEGASHTPYEIWTQASLPIGDGTKKCTKIIVCYNDDNVFALLEDGTLWYTGEGYYMMGNAVADPNAPSFIQVGITNVVDFDYFGGKIIVLKGV